MNHPAGIAEDIELPHHEPRTRAKLVGLVEPPSGEDIDRDFIERTDCWDGVIRVALSAAQVRGYGLPVNPGKSTDSRAAGFISRHGALMQVELDALDPDELRRLFQAAIDEYWDTSAYAAVLGREREQRRRIGGLLDALDGTQ